MLAPSFSVFVFQLCFTIYVATSKSGLRFIVVKALLKMLKSFYHRHTTPDKKESEDEKVKETREKYHGNRQKVEENEKIS